MKARELTSAGNPRVKAARRLQDRREREDTGLFLAEGPHVLEVALSSGVGFSEVFCTGDFLESHAELAARLEAGDWPVWRVSEEVLHKVAGTEQPQGVVAVVPMRSSTGSPFPMPDAQCQIGAKTQEEGFGVRCSVFGVEGEDPRGPGVGKRKQVGGARRGPMLVLALEGVSDPGNVGNAIRAAHAAGASLVVVGPGCCDRFNPKAVRASAGGLFAVPSLETDDLVGLIERLRASGARVVAAVPGEGRCQVPGVRCWGSKKEEMEEGQGTGAEGPVSSLVPRPASRPPAEARVCWELDLRGPTVLVVGSEACGLSESVLAVATDRATIPMPGGAESLNAAAAAAVLLYEAIRQRNPSAVRRTGNSNCQAPTAK